MKLNSWPSKERDFTVLAVDTLKIDLKRGDLQFIKQEIVGPRLDLLT